MKKMMLGLSIAMLAAMIVVSCKKENVKISDASQQVKENTETNGNKRLVNITLTAVADYYCGTQVPCGINTIASTRNNRISITKNALTIATYPTLRFTYYKSTGIVGGIETFAQIAQYTCSDNTVHFASSLLDNATRIYVIANTPAYPAPSTTIQYSGGYVITDGSAWNTWGGVLATTTSYKGQVCLQSPIDPL